MKNLAVCQLFVAELSCQDAGASHVAVLGVHVISSLAVASVDFHFVELLVEQLQAVFVIHSQELIVILLCDAVRHSLAVYNGRHDIVASSCLFYADFPNDGLTSTIDAVEEGLAGQQGCNLSATDGVRILFDSCLFCVDTCHFLTSCLFVAFALLGDFLLLSQQAFLFEIRCLVFLVGFAVLSEADAYHVLAFQHVACDALLEVLELLGDLVVDDAKACLYRYTVLACCLRCCQLANLLIRQAILIVTVVG